MMKVKIKMKLKKILYGLSAIAIIAVVVYNVKTGNNYSVVNLLPFNLVALSSESTPGESTGGTGGICKQNHVPKESWNGTITVGGVLVRCKYRENYTCTDNGSLSSCKVGSIYWNTNNVEVYNSVVTSYACGI
jgi:hypothetical protein